MKLRLTNKGWSRPVGLFLLGKLPEISRTVRRERLLVRPSQSRAFVLVFRKGGERMKKETKKYLFAAIMACDSEEPDLKKFEQNLTELAKIVTLDAEEMKELNKF